MSSRTPAENKKQMKDALNTASSAKFSSHKPSGNSSHSASSSVNSSLPGSDSRVSNNTSRALENSSRASDVTPRASDKGSRASGTKSFSPTRIMMEKGLIGPEVHTGYDLREHLQQIMKLSDAESSESCSVDSYDEDSEDGEDELRQLVGRGDQPPTPKPTTEKTASTSLVPIDEEDLDSEEENAIMKEIKDEIVKQVRGEMKSELDLFRAQHDNLEGKTSTSGASGATEGLENLEPDLREAFIKMRKLDKVLAKRVRREKAVKRDRILLERRIRSEIEQMRADGKESYSDVATNTQKFLALELPPRHNEGVVIPENFPEEPVFRTQLNEEEYAELTNKDRNRNRNRNRAADSETSSVTGTESQDGRSQGDEAGSQADETGSASGKKHRKKHRQKDFIKRNKELAADADKAIAMTEEEKKRLEGLLLDVDNIPDMEEDDTAEGSTENPFQLAVHPGEGFHPDQDELRSLTSIDARLKEIMPPDDYRSIASSSMSHIPQHKLFTRTAVKSTVEFEQCGERALLEAKEQRDMTERLRAIEEELAKLHNPEEMEIETPHLEEDQLHDLIDQCVTSLSLTSMSRTSMSADLTTSRTSFTDTESQAEQTQDNSPRSPRSARQDILDNPPRLPPAVLQQLLSEAYYPMSKQLSTLQEEDDEDDTKTPIPAEVWKIIAMEDVDKNRSPSQAKKEGYLRREGSVNGAEVGERLHRKEDGGRLSRSEDEERLSQREDEERLSRREDGERFSRNGQRNISQMSSQSNLSNGAHSDNGRDSVLSGRDSKTPFLPEIDPSGTLVTQGLNNQTFSQRSNSSSSIKVPLNMVRNSLAESKVENESSDRMEVMSFDGDFVTPRPPTGEKRQHSSKSRTVTPVTNTRVSNSLDPEEMPIISISSGSKL